MSGAQSRSAFPELPRELLELRARSVLSAVDVELARVLSRLSPQADSAVLLAAALASRAVQRGHVCLDLASLDRRELLDQDDQPVPVKLPDFKRWRLALSQSALVARVTEPLARADFRPLVLDDRGRLYLFRYYDYQTRLARNLLERVSAGASTARAVDHAALKASLTRLFPQGDARPASLSAESSVDLQRLAALVSVCAPFSVLSGGPGTGKTTTVVKILAALVEQAYAFAAPPPRFLLLAPTGKAAQRLAESVSAQRASLDCAPHVLDSIPTAASTVHRALGFQPKSPTRFAHNADEPLAADCVLVDECSMVDLPLLTKLVEAVPAGARLILMGDKDQLSSVETGAILGDIFSPALPRAYSAELAQRAFELTSDRINAETGPEPAVDSPNPQTRPLEQAQAVAPEAGAVRALPELPGGSLGALGDSPEGLGASPELRGSPQARGAAPELLRDSMVQLTRSYRYTSEGGIGALARAINAGDAKALKRLLGQRSASDSQLSLVSDEIELLELEPQATEARVAELAVAGFSDYIRAQTIEDKLAAFGRFRVLAAHRRGPLGVEQLNQICEAALARAGLIRPYRRGQQAGARERSVWYENQPIMVIQNDYELGLFNGDVGIIGRDPQGQLRAWFPVQTDHGRAQAPHSQQDSAAVDRGVNSRPAGATSSNSRPAGATSSNVRGLLPARLPPHQAVYAMTVHKSQGSEFEQVLFVLPAKESPVLTRELIYTAVTRAKARVTLVGNRAVLTQGVSRRIWRASGLSDALWGPAVVQAPQPTLPSAPRGAEQLKLF